MPCEIEVHTTLTFRENVAPFLSIAIMWCSGSHSRGGQGVNLRVQVAPFLPSTRDTGLRWNGTSAEPGFAGVMATRPSALQDGERRARRAPHAWSGLPGERLPVTSRPWPLFPGAQGHVGLTGHFSPPVLPKCVGRRLGFVLPGGDLAKAAPAALRIPLTCRRPRDAALPPHARACASRPTFPLRPWRCCT